MNPIRIRECQAMMQSLITEYPELLENEKLKADMLESETDYHELLRVLFLEERVTKQMHDALDPVVNDVKRRQARLLGRAMRLRATMMALMQSAESKTERLPEGTLSVSYRKPEPIQPASHEGFDECWIKYTPRLDWAAVKAAIADGQTFPGIEFTNGAPQLRVLT